MTFNIKMTIKFKSMFIFKRHFKKIHILFSKKGHPFSRSQVGMGGRITENQAASSCTGEMQYGFSCSDVLVELYR